ALDRLVVHAEEAGVEAAAAAGEAVPQHAAGVQEGLALGVGARVLGAEADRTRGHGGSYGRAPGARPVRAGGNGPESGLLRPGGAGSTGGRATCRGLPVTTFRRPFGGRGRGGGLHRGRIS